MDKYIIEYTMTIDGIKDKKLYHQDIENSTSLEGMNVYVEHINTKELAKRFFDKEEAERVAIFFSRTFQTSKILTVKR